MFKTMFRPPGTLYNLQLGFIFMLLSPRSLARMQRTVATIALCALPVPVLLYVVLYWMWLETNSGEANFLYFQCLAYNVFVAFLLIDFCGASLRRDKVNRTVEKRRNEKKVEKSTSQQHYDAKRDQSDVTEFTKTSETVSWHVENSSQSLIISSLSRQLGRDTR